MEQVSGDPILLPLDRELQERLDWYIRLRWLAGASILAVSALGAPVLGKSLPFPSISLLALAVLSYNLVFYLYRHQITSRPGLPRRAIHLQIALDYAALTFLTDLTGGITSPITVSYVFHLIIGAILLSRRACYFLACGASLLTGFLALDSAFKFMPAVPGTRVFPEASPIAALGIWAGLTLYFGVITYLMTSITGRLREKEKALSSSERALDRSYHEMESLHDIGQIVNSSLDVNEVLSLIAESTTRLFNAKACFLRLFDKSGKRLYIGGAYGFSQAYINKGPVDVEKSPVDSEVLQGKTIQVFEVGDDYRFQYREEAKREGLRSMLSCPIRAKNRTLGVIRVYTDKPHVFSEQEERLLLNLANLGAVAIQNARSYSELVALDQERVWFARTTHHQLRSPLAAVQGAIEALPFAGSLNEVQEDLLARARRRIQDSFDTIRDLLDLAAAQRISDKPLTDPVVFEDALKRALETAREQARLKGLSFVEELEGTQTKILAEPADLDRIFSNLLNNAVKYTFSGRVRFTVRTTEGWIEARVEDTGIGIAAEEMDRVFKGFYRSAAAKATGEVGTGLGLSIVRQVVERLGGSISVLSEPSRGTCFVVRLPACDALVAPPA